MTPAAFDLFTIGHSNHPIERFLELARGAGITAIADVRSTPASRRYPWFNQARLAPRLAGEGITYVHLGEPLGGHRCLLVARALAERGFGIGHVLADATIEPHAHTEERLLKLAGAPADLFAHRGQRLAAAYARRAGTAAYRRLEKPL